MGRGQIKLFILIIFLWSFKSKAFFTPIQSQLQKYSSSISQEEIITNLLINHKNLNIIVLDITNERFPSDNIIEWNNPNISAEAFDFYQNYSEGQIQTVAFHLPPKGQLSHFSHRPLEDSHLVVLAKNVPTHALLHEIGHFLINNRSDHPLDNKNSEELKNALRLYEEAYIDKQLIEMSTQLGFSEKELCRRHSYMSGNLSTLRSILKDFRPQNEEQKQLQSKLYNLTSPIKMLALEHHTTCFFQ